MPVVAMVAALGKVGGDKVGDKPLGVPEVLEYGRMHAPGLGLR